MQPDVDPYGPFPAEWERLIGEVMHAGGAPNTREAAKARLQAHVLMADLQHRVAIADSEQRQRKAGADAAASHARAVELHAAAMKTQATALTWATWVLAAATLGLFIATVVLVTKTGQG